MFCTKTGCSFARFEDGPQGGQAQEDCCGDFALMDKMTGRLSQTGAIHAAVSPRRPCVATPGSERGLLASALAIGCLGLAVKKLHIFWREPLLLLETDLVDYDLSFYTVREIKQDSAIIDFRAAYKARDGEICPLARI